MASTINKVQFLLSFLKSLRLSKFKPPGYHEDEEITSSAVMVVASAS